MISRTLDFALLAVSMEGGSWYRLQALAKVTWSMFLVPKSLNGTFGDLDGDERLGILGHGWDKLRRISLSCNVRL